MMKQINFWSKALQLCRLNIKDVSKINICVVFFAFDYSFDCWSMMRLFYFWSKAQQLCRLNIKDVSKTNSSVLLYP